MKHSLKNCVTIALFLKSMKRDNRKESDPMNSTIRKVQQGDEKTLAYIQTESWKAAFAEILPADLLKRCTDIDKAEKMYSGLLKDNIGNGYILEINNKAHCIAYWDASREADMAGYAELICIHSLQDGWRHGYGSQMMIRVLDDIRNAGFNKVMLWVFKENTRAISFYEKHGFTANGKSQEALGATEVMYEMSWEPRPQTIPAALTQVSVVSKKEIRFYDTQRKSFELF